MPTIKVDRYLFERLVNRWMQLDFENRAYVAVLREAEQRNPEAAKIFQALFDWAKNDVQAQNMEIDRKLRTAWVCEDDGAFLRLLDSQLSRHQSGQ